MKISRGKILKWAGLGLAALVILAVIFLVAKYQFNTIRQVKALFGNQPHSSSTAEQIEYLQKQIEELKNQKSQVQPAASTPLPDLTTDQDLKTAKQQISSLERQLSQIQSKPQPAAAPSDSNLIKSWQADKKVVQVACENKTTGYWQLGSGVLISSDGKVLTNQHVVQGDGIANFLPDFCLILFTADYDAAGQKYTRQYRASIAGFFTDRDAALLKINDVMYKGSDGAIQTDANVGPFQYFPAASSRPSIGDPVWVIGFPESAKLAFSITKGIISNFTSDLLYFGTDAQIDRGNSGGAAVNSAGELVGLPTWKYAGSGDYRGYILDISTLAL